MHLINIVASGDLCQKLDLESLHGLGERYHYNSTRYHAGFIQLSHCKATIYNSGKYMFMGLKDPNFLEETWVEFIAVLSPFIDSNLVIPPTVRNMVLLKDLNRPLDLNRIYSNRQEGVEYEPEQFPGLIYTLNQGTILVFSTGKIIITGVRSLIEADMALSQIQADILA